MKRIKELLYIIRVQYVIEKYMLMMFANKFEVINTIYHYFWRERSTSYGEENSDKVFYIIRRISPMEGVCSMLNSVVGHLAYAESKGYIPVVDMKNYYNVSWQPFSKRKKENAWEYYFEQPAGYSLSDIQHSKNIILSDGINAHKVPNLQGTLNCTEVEKWHEIYQKYIRLNDKIEKKLSNDEKKMESGNTLGVCERVGILAGKKRKTILYAGYAKSITVKHMINEVERRMKLNNCNKIFLVIDDDETAEIFKQYFKNKLFLYKRKRYKYLQNGEPPKKKELIFEDVIIPKNVSYIKEIFLLARCSSLLCDQSTGAMTAIIINGNQYENRTVLRV